MLKRLISLFFLVIILATNSLASDYYQTSGMKQNPYDWQVQREIDRRVVGNELIWQYVRPGETRGGIGCHESPDKSPPPTNTFPKATSMKALKAVPRGDDLRYQAKMWWKGTAPWPREERMRTVNAVNLLGRP